MFPWADENCRRIVLLASSVVQEVLWRRVERERHCARVRPDRHGRLGVSRLGGVPGGRAAGWRLTAAIFSYPHSHPGSASRRTWSCGILGTELVAMVLEGGFVYDGYNPRQSCSYSRSRTDGREQLDGRLTPITDVSHARVALLAGRDHRVARLSWRWDLAVIVRCGSAKAASVHRWQVV